ncbi:hypothetical protein PoB_003353400 [Plakobranchus ocellatus]|uniref:C2H2-type domain-containing protein n=1 Tax=Plakobranchus ocellatus TaxID=259542 RepID=A0AAV4AKX3_9GAST|nr:hypothetical protein PoB_003353400 [Plakobranchus ocellatus]
MSRRKQARPKSCKTEEVGDLSEMVELSEENETEGSNPIAAVTEDKAESQTDEGHTTFVEDVSTGHNSSSLLTTTSPPPSATAAAAVAIEELQAEQQTTSESHQVAVEDAEESKVMRCETCGALFTTLDDFMDHRNFVCGAGNDETRNFLLSDAPPTRSLSPSSQSTSSADASGPASSADVDCVGELDGLDPTQVPYVIGVTDDNPHGCHFCEKAFSKKGYAKLHEQRHAGHTPYKWGVGGIVDSESALRSAGTLLSRVRAPPPATGLT